MARALPSHGRGRWFESNIAHQENEGRRCVVMSTASLAEGARFDLVSKLCERPGCSESGAAVYGMVPENLLFWIAPISGTPTDDHNVLCLRHADAMSVPRGWTLDDRREEIPRLFKPRPVSRREHPATQRATRPVATVAEPVEQLVIDGTGEIRRPDVVDEPARKVSDTLRGDEAVTPWEPSFDHDNDLDGLLEVSSPLLARAFRGTDRRRS
jgi:hypothetical protein